MFHDPVCQGGHLQPAQSPGRLGDVDPHQRAGRERAVRQALGELADPAGSADLELLHLRAGHPVGQCGIPRVGPGIQQRLLGERTCEQFAHATLRQAR
jgi:hypothetical protein